MNCFNCALAVPHLCKADCCEIVPIPKKTFLAFKEMMVTQPDFIHEEFKNFITPVTASGKCVFLDKNYHCVIYDHRPDVCKIYGKAETLQCEYISMDGVLRTSEDRQDTSERMNAIARNRLVQIAGQDNSKGNLIIAPRCEDVPYRHEGDEIYQCSRCNCDVYISQLNLGVCSELNRDNYLLCNLCYKEIKQLI